MTLDPRTPVIVGAGWVNQRDRQAEPIDVMAGAVERALDDAGPSPLRDRIEAVCVVYGVWPYRDPGRLVAGRIGAPAARTSLTPMGGNQVDELIADTAARIQRGELDVAVVCAAETIRTRRADRAASHPSRYISEPDDARPDEVVGSDTPLSLPSEEAVGVHIPTVFYAMVESAIRHRTGEPVDVHRARIAGMWSEASEVAATNPGAWSTTPFSAEQIADESSSNRPVAAPYPKLMTANIDVDQGGALVICSAGAAQAAGIAPERWVFAWSAAAAADPFPTNRWAFDESPALAAAGAAALGAGGLGIDDLELLDLYSCFPSAVQVAQRELGISPDRPWTITGGLTFAAGPLHCYCILAAVRAVTLLREQPMARALLTGNGGYLSKHSALVLSGSPAATPFRFERLGAPGRRRPTPSDRPAVAALEAYTVTFARDGTPDRAIMATLDAAGGRHWSTSDDPTSISELLADDACGRPISLH